MDMANSKTRLAACICAAAVIAVIVAFSVYLALRGKSGEDIVYKETKAEYGSLTVGITKEASITIGTKEQTFGLDISALEVDSVLAAVGQEIKAGDPLYTLTSESVDEIRKELSDDIDDTKADYEVLKVSQEESKTQAKQKYDTYVINGKYALPVYENELKAYQEAVDKAAEDVGDNQASYNEKMLELAELQKEYAEAGKLLKEANAAVSENYEGRHGNAYYYTVYLNTQQTVQKRYDQLKDDIESKNKEIEQLALDIQSSVRTMNQAQRDYEKAKLELGQTRDVDMYYAKASAEWRGIQTASLDNELSTSKRKYESAVEKLEKFDSRVQDNKILSEYSGVVTAMHLEAGDTLLGGSALVTLNDGESVTMEAKVGEDDYKTVDKEGKVNIVFTAYPDEVYSGLITEVSDAEYDSSSASVYYTLTVTVQGDVVRLYEGMTGDVTFVTKETKEVLYVSNRAVIREGTKSYVKVRDGKGNIVQQEIDTGFSDGVNVEVISGLSEGDIVLIENKVGL